MTKKYFLLGTFFLCLLGLGILFSPSPSWAQENVLGLDGSNRYDVYISGYGDSLSILKDVEIVSIRKFYDKQYLFVRTDQFNSRKSEGLIAFDSVRAILPTDKPGIQGLPIGTKINYFRQ